MFRGHVALGLGASAVAVLALLACRSGSGRSSSSSGEPASAAAGSSRSSGDQDAGEPLVNSCKTFVDHTAAADARVLTWDPSVYTSPDRCMKIKVGQSVSWAGDFTTHPLAAVGGKVPNPVRGANLSTSPAAIAFPVDGTYGYQCMSHPSMTGAIQVVP